MGVRVIDTKSIKIIYAGLALALVGCLVGCKAGTSEVISTLGGLLPQASPTASPRITPAPTAAPTSTPVPTPVATPSVSPSSSPSQPTTSALSAGPDRSITLPTSSLSITATSTQTLNSFVWTRVAGPNVPVLSGANTATLTLSNLVQGTYFISVTAKNAAGATLRDDVRVSVYSTQYPRASGLIYYDDAEDAPTLVGCGVRCGGTRQGWQGTVGDGRTANAPKIVASNKFARKGLRSYELKIGTQTSGDLHSYKNALTWNIQPPGHDKWENTMNIPAHAHHWTAYSTYIPVDQDIGTQNLPGGLFMISYKPMSEDWACKSGSPSFMPTWVYAGKYKAIVPVIDTANNCANFEFVEDLGNVVKGVWEDWVVHRNYTHQQDGFIRIYRGGKLVYQKNGPNWASPRALGGPEGLEPYVQIENYSLPKLSPVTIYMDEIKFGGEDMKTLEFFP